jgi:hypothetical protein
MAIRQVPVRINPSSAGLLERQLSPESFNPDHQLRVGPAPHAMDELEQVQRRLQLLLARRHPSPGTDATPQSGVNLGCQDPAQRRSLTNISVYRICRESGP